MGDYESHISVTPMVEPGGDQIQELRRPSSPLYLDIAVNV